MQNKNLQNLLKKVNEKMPVQQSEAKLIILNEKLSNEIKGGCGGKCGCNGINDAEIGIDE